MRPRYRQDNGIFMMNKGKGNVGSKMCNVYLTFLEF